MELGPGMAPEDGVLALKRISVLMLVLLVLHLPLPRLRTSKPKCGAWLMEVVIVDGARLNSKPRPSITNPLNSSRALAHSVCTAVRGDGVGNSLAAVMSFTAVKSAREHLVRRDLT